MKAFVVSIAMCACVLGVAAPAGADPPLMVVGAGSSAISGHVVVNARATGPLSGGVAPADGTFRAQRPSGEDLSGTVTCIGLLFPGRAVVSGTLDTPVVSGGFTFPHFSLVVDDSGSGRDSWIGLFVTNLSAMGGLEDCGTLLFFDAALTMPEALPFVLVRKGSFQILGDA